MECKQDIEESSDEWRAQPKSFVAMCAVCARAIVLGGGVANCRDCETQTRQEVPAERMIGKTPVCDMHYRQRMGLPAVISTRRPTCYPCQEQGKHVPATTKMNGMNMCAEHAGAAAIETREPDVLEEGPETEKKEKQKMPRRAEVDWKEVQEKRNAGAKLAELAKEFGVSLPTIHNHTRPAKGAGRGRPPGRLSAIADRATPKAGQGGISLIVANALAELKAEHAKIGKAIEIMQTLEGIDA